MSSLAVRMRFPSCEKTADCTFHSCPVRVSNSRPSTASHTRAVLSSPAVASRVPSLVLAAVFVLVTTQIWVVGFLADLPRGVLTAANVEYHAEIVREKSIQRSLLEICLDISRQAYENAADASDLLQERGDLRAGETRLCRIAGPD